MVAQLDHLGIGPSKFDQLKVCLGIVSMYGLVWDSASYILLDRVSESVVYLLMMSVSYWIDLGTLSVNLVVAYIVATSVIFVYLIPHTLFSSFI